MAEPYIPYVLLPIQFFVKEEAGKLNQPDLYLEMAVMFVFGTCPN